MLPFLWAAPLIFWRHVWTKNGDIDGTCKRNLNVKEHFQLDWKFIRKIRAATVVFSHLKFSHLNAKNSTAG